METGPELLKRIESLPLDEQVREVQKAMKYDKEVRTEEVQDWLYEHAKYILSKDWVA